MTDLKMIVGLGNPGPGYVKNRHNIGFQVVDLLAARHAIELGKLQNRARLGMGWMQRDGERAQVMLVKPLTYMNDSGEAVGPLLRYYHVDLGDMMVIHDDLDLDSGKLRVRPKGGSGGQNGIRSIIQHVGAQEFPRVRVGIGRPSGRMDPAAFVLQNFTSTEEEVFAILRLAICDAVVSWVFDGIDAAMNRFNSGASSPEEAVEP